MDIMTEIEILERILLNFGESAPWLVLVFLFMRFMWPNIYSLLLKYLDVREKMLCQPDPVAVRLEGLSDQVVRLISSLDMFVGEMRLTTARVSTNYTTAGVSALVEGVQKQTKGIDFQPGGSRGSSTPEQESNLRGAESTPGG